jgi:6-phosphogluconolactonase (cycloisomerase 2 family)
MRLPLSSRSLSSLGALALVGACGGGGGGGAGTPPQALSYPALGSVPETCLALAELVPSVAGGAPTRFRVSPALPAGLVLDSLTGVLRGTPQQSAPERTYTISASNSAGETSAQVTFEVREVALAGLDYGGANLPLAIGVHERLAPQLASGRAAHFEIVAGALPAGVSLDPTSGALEGAPDSSALDQPFAVTVRARDCRDAWVDVTLAFDVGLPQARAAILLNDGEPVLSTYLPAEQGGALVPFEHALGGDTAASEVVASPDGRVLFLAEGDRAALRSYLRSAEGRWLPSAHVVGTGTAAAIALAAVGTRVYALTAEPRLLGWSVDPASGAFELLGEELDLPAEPTALALDPQGRFAFVSGAFDAELATLALLAPDGAPSASTRLSGVGALASLTVARGGDYLIGADLVGGLRVFAIHPQSGALSPVSGSPLATGSGAGAVWAHPYADFVVSARSFEGLLDVFTLGANGSLLPVPSTPFACERAATRLCATPDGARVHALVEHYGWLAYELAADGTLSPSVAPRCAPRGGARSMAFVPGSRADVRVALELFAAGGEQPLVCTIELDGTLVPKSSPETGAGLITRIEPHPWIPVAYVTRAGLPSEIADIAADGTLVPRAGTVAGPGASGLYVDPSGRFAYEVIEGFGARIRCWTVQPDGSLAAGGEVPLPDGPLALAFHPSGEFVHVACTGGASLETYAIDWATGELVEWGTTLFGATPRTLAIDASGTSLAVLDDAGSSVHVFALDAPTGLPYLLPGGYQPVGSGATTLLFTPAGERLIVGGAHGASLSAFYVDRVSGALTAAGAIAGAVPLATVLGSDGRTLYAALPGGLVARIDCATLATLDSTSLGADATALSMRLKLR